MDDPFVDIFFTDARGNESKPVLCQEAHDALIEADLIILSTGTQWSSLIPTYASSGFKSVMDQCDAKIIMVMNRIPDKDSPGQSASDLIDILVPQYFPESRLHVLCDNTAHDLMRSENIDWNIKSTVAGIYSFNLSFSDSTKHSPRALAKSISSIYWNIDKDKIKDTTYVFDYDDTLIGRGNAYEKASQYNIYGLSALNENTKVAVCTGNSIKAVKLTRKQEVMATGMLTFRFDKPILRVFADGGINEYAYSTNYEVSDDQVGALAMRHLDPSKVLGRAELSLVMRRLKEAGIPVAKIENRGDTVIAIKPIDREYRDSITRLLELTFLSQYGVNESWAVTPTGRTTIEISKAGISKVRAIEELLAASFDPVVFIGDELDYGNDFCIKELSKKNAQLSCLKVRSPVHTAWLIHTLLDNLNVIMIK
jgi:hypothetical protein